jgi:hypothetical protein
LLVAYGLFAPCEEMGVYIPVWLMFLIMRVGKTEKRQHSRYQGYPWLCRMIPFMNNEYKARLAEPFVLFAGGMLVMQYSPAMSVFLLSGCVSLLAILSAESGAIAVRKRAMEDAMKEGQQMMNISRGGSGWGD